MVQQGQEGWGVSRCWGGCRWGSISEVETGRREGQQQKRRMSLMQVDRKWKEEWDWIRCEWDVSSNKHAENPACDQAFVHFQASQAELVSSFRFVLHLYWSSQTAKLTIYVTERLYLICWFFLFFHTYGDQHHDIILTCRDLRFFSHTKTTSWFLAGQTLN